MYVLGISCYYHDSSATLLKDGKIISGAEEERFTRKKHDSSFPINSINYCLEHAGIDINAIEHIGFYEKPLNKFERVLYQHLEMFPKSLKTFLSSMPSWINQKLRIMKAIRKDLKYKKDVLFIDHHLAHASSSFLVSPFKESAILTIDGVGEWTTTSYGSGSDIDITLLKHIKFPHSLGLLYSTVTAYLGFSVNNSEYKVMGLAAYGDMSRSSNPYYKKLSKVIDIKDDGSYHLNMQYFSFHYKDRMPSKEFCKLMGHPISIRDCDMTQRHKDIAAAVQLITEDVMHKMLCHVYKETGSKNIVIAGGVALNSVNNGKILKNTGFENIWIQPNASDGGTSLGVASYIYNTILRNPRTYKMTDAYLGPGYDNKYVEKFLSRKGIHHSEFYSDEALIEVVSQLLNNNNVVGWFQGRMEWGPRALGNRSILANPCNPSALELLNLKVKHREKFRPFAPVVCEDDALTYFDCDSPVPSPTDYMLMVYPIFAKWHKEIPSVTHVDGSGRLQTIREEQNPRYYNLIKSFGKHSGVPILINTSFNIRGEPIVCSPEDAYRCMMGTEIDYLVMDNYIIKRSDNPRDIWDSEKNAKD